MQTAVTGAIASNVITLPSDFRQVQSLRVASGSTYAEIYPLPPERLADTLTTSFPVGYVVVGDEIKTIGGSGSEDYAMTYFAAVPALSESAPGEATDQNWLILREPGLYLYGALIEASPYLGDDQRTVVWAAQFKAILDSMQTEDDSARYGNAPSMRGSLTNAP